MAEWGRIRLPTQETQVPSLILEDPACRRAPSPMHCNDCAGKLQLPKPAPPEPVPCSQRSPRSEKPLQPSKEAPPFATTRENPLKGSEDPEQPKINKSLKEIISEEIIRSS